MDKNTIEERQRRVYAHVGTRIAHYRATSGTTIDRLSRQTKIPSERLVDIEAGLKPRSIELVRIACELEVPLSRLFDD